MSVRRNLIYNTIYQIFMIVLPLITVPYVSRVLGPNGVGAYSYTGAYAQYFILIGTIGIALYGNRQIAYTKNNKENVSKTFWSIFYLQFLTTSLSTIIYFVIFLGINKDNRVLYAVQSLQIIAAIFDISWFFIGFEELRGVVVRNSIVKIVGIVFIFLFVKDSSDVSIYAFIIGMSGLIGQLIMWINIPKKVLYFRPAIADVTSHLKPALALFISQLAVQVYILLDKTMLGLFTNSYEVGLYDNSQRTIKLVLTIVTSLGVVMLPRMSSLFSEGNEKKFKEMIYKAFSYVNFLSIPMVAGLILVADNFVGWFYGEEFTSINLLLKVGALIIFAISWSNILGMQIMLPMKKEKEFTISVTVGAIINVILNLILINSLKALGTTISSVVAELAVTLTQIYFLRNIVDIKKVIKTTYKPLFSSIIMFGIVSILKINIQYEVLITIIQVSIGIVVYITMMVVLKDKLLIEILNQLKNKIINRGKLI